MTDMCMPRTPYIHAWSVASVRQYDYPRVRHRRSNLREKSRDGGLGLHPDLGYDGGLGEPRPDMGGIGEMPIARVVNSKVCFVFKWNRVEY